VNSHGRRRQQPARAGSGQSGPGQFGPVQLGWALLVVAAALIGGLAAATLVDVSVTIAVIVSVVAGGIGVVILFRSPARSPELMAGGRPDQQTGRYPIRGRPAPPVPQAPRAAPPASFPADPVAPGSAAPGSAAPGPAAPGPAGRDGQGRGGHPAANETVVQLLPLGSQPGQPAGSGPPDAPWWDSPQGAPPPSPGAKRAPAPDLSTYLASTFIAQCPRCGGFRLDIRRAGSGWDFRCESCEYTWTWQPGTPWPPVRVMPP
jgi:hypothetical protein